MGIIYVKCAYLHWVVINITKKNYGHVPLPTRLFKAFVWLIFMNSIRQFRVYTGDAVRQMKYAKQVAIAEIEFVFIY